MPCAPHGLHQCRTLLAEIGQHEIRRAGNDPQRPLQPSARQQLAGSCAPRRHKLSQKRRSFSAASAATSAASSLRIGLSASSPASRSLPRFARITPRRNAASAAALENVRDDHQIGVAPNPRQQRHIARTRNTPRLPERACAAPLQIIRASAAWSSNVPVGLFGLARKEYARRSLQRSQHRHRAETHALAVAH